ncbi:hypothetical protein [Dolichospermum compactum]|uniref:Uncharacterized protein n=1 Tax=Dolichospermum compactum NIES-806 TaxID=1973481 RepID=A0A1Z4V6L3_9CYAN|nr:hypothetical protein [Dolichospermum compactum]BAZ86895.1 hypothetical protein NIES806_31120 [Dolichospermum compactum NIES-806]
MVESLLAVRFGNLDEELSAIISQLMELSLTERTQLLLNLSNLSREELLAKFNKFESNYLSKKTGKDDFIVLCRVMDTEFS